MTGAQVAAKSAFQEDLARYPGAARWTERSLWAIGTYRPSRDILQIRNAPARWLILPFHVQFARLIETITKISVPVYANIGAGLKIARGGLVFVHAQATLGRSCTLQEGVTIGNTAEDGSAPVVGDGVEFGAYVQALGGIRIGDGGKIASMSVVLEDVRPGGVAIGMPAKVLTGSAAVAARWKPTAGDALRASNSLNNLLLRLR